MSLPASVRLIITSRSSGVTTSMVGRPNRSGFADWWPSITTWRRMRLCGAAHAVDDLYQGLVPACVPYLVL
ncbi:MAG: hypothetical protein ACR2P2_05020, partial [Nakamurella sp.]